MKLREPIPIRKCRRCRRFRAGVCPLDDLEPCRYIPKIPVKCRIRIFFFFLKMSGGKL